jgi:hypothetical protein
MLLVRNFEEDWETGGRGGEDLWAVADTLVKRRRAGETTGRCSGLTTCQFLIASQHTSWPTSVMLPTQLNRVVGGL